MIGIRHKYRSNSNSFGKQLKAISKHFLLSLFILSSAIFAQTKVEVEIHKKKSDRRVQTKVIYSIKPEKVWRILSQYTSLRYFLPRVKKSEVSSKETNSALVYLVIDSPWPWKDVWTKVKVRQNIRKQSFEWQQTEGDFKHFFGKAWLDIEQSTDRKSTFYTDFHLDMGSAIPKILQSWALKYYIPKILRQLENTIKQSKPA